MWCKVITLSAGAREPHSETTKMVAQHHVNMNAQQLDVSPRITTLYATIAIRGTTHTQAQAASCPRQCPTPALRHLSKFATSSSKESSNLVEMTVAVDNAPSTSGNEAVVLNSTTFAYPGCEPFIKGCNLNLPRGSRCLLIGANGAGKTTLLQIVAGKYMVAQDSVRVLTRSPFHDLVSRASW
jgi:ATPase subunit of ABC transporter with duplicated ATPase domains